MTKRLRFCGLALAGIMILALPVSHLLWGAPPAGNKQLICHMSDDPTVTTGKVLEIAKQAIPAHCRNHARDFTNLPATAVKGGTCTPPTGARVCAALP